MVRIFADHELFGLREAVPQACWDRKVRQGKPPIVFLLVSRHWGFTHLPVNGLLRRVVTSLDDSSQVLFQWARSGRSRRVLEHAVGHELSLLDSHMLVDWQAQAALGHCFGMGQ